MDSPHWGTFRGVGMLTNADGSLNGTLVGQINNLLDRFGDGGDTPPWVLELLSEFPKQRFEVTETSDVLPLSPWVVSGILSLDIDRCFASLFAGDDVFPDLVVDSNYMTRHKSKVPETQVLGNLKDTMQQAYTDAYLQVVKRSKKYDHVIGYDVMNEPVGVFLMMAIGGLFKDLAPEPETCKEAIDCVLPQDCAPGRDNWPGCASEVLPEIDPNLDDAQRAMAIEAAYNELVSEAGEAWECIDERGLNASGETPMKRVGVVDSNPDGLTKT